MSGLNGDGGVCSGDVLPEGEGRSSGGCDTELEDEGMSWCGD